MHNFNMSVTYSQNIKMIPLKALGRVDFIKWALSSVTYHMYIGRELARLKNVHFFKKNISSLNFHMHIFNMSVRYPQNIKMIYQRH